MPYILLAFISCCMFASVHIFAQKTAQLNPSSQARLLSFGGGVAIAYVFIDLLPKLAKSDLLVRALLQGFFPYFERHVYILALAGFLLFYLVERSSSFDSKKASFWLSFGSCALFNFLIGYAVADKNNPEVRPLVLFTCAIALHYFTIDYSFNKSHPLEYQEFGKWLLIAALFLGWGAAFLITLSKTAIALVSAFIGGGVIMNVTRHELPKENPNSLPAFLIGTFAYTFILLFIG